MSPRIRDAYIRIRDAYIRAALESLEGVDPVEENRGWPHLSLAQAITHALGHAAILTPLAMQRWVDHPEKDADMLLMDTPTMATLLEEMTGCTHTPVIRPPAPGTVWRQWGAIECQATDRSVDIMVAPGGMLEVRARRIGIEAATVAWAGRWG